MYGGLFIGFYAFFSLVILGFLAFRVAKNQTLSLFSKAGRALILGLVYVLHLWFAVFLINTIKVHKWGLENPPDEPGFLFALGVSASILFFGVLVFFIVERRSRNL